jgi:hypothetical protein
MEVGVLLFRIDKEDHARMAEVRFAVSLNRLHRSTSERQVAGVVALRASAFSCRPAAEEALAQPRTVRQREGDRRRTGETDDEHAPGRAACSSDLNDLTGCPVREVGVTEISALTRHHPVRNPDWYQVIRCWRDAHHRPLRDPPAARSAAASADPAASLRWSRDADARINLIGVRGPRTVVLPVFISSWHRWTGRSDSLGMLSQGGIAGGHRVPAAIAVTAICDRRGRTTICMKGAASLQLGRCIARCQPPMARRPAEFAMHSDAA